nr:SIS domain-containing protein [Ferrimicrobium acidiphilum]
MSFAGAYFEELGRVSARLSLEDCNRAADSLLQTWQREGTVVTAGNGGSASTSSHFASDLQKLTIVKTLPRLRALSLNDNVPVMTAWSNDSSYADVFLEQARNVLRSGDLVFCVSASGNSPNILRLSGYARSFGVPTIGLIGYDGGKLKELVDVSLIVPSGNMQIIEDVHLAICHMLASHVRSALQNFTAVGTLVADDEDFGR